MVQLFTSFRNSDRRRGAKETGRGPTVDWVMTTAATAIDDRAAELLRELAGPGAAFRAYQRSV